MNIPFYQIDAFTRAPFTGNPAAICLLEEWPHDTLLQAIALAGGTIEFAKTDRIVVLRDGARERFQVRVNAIAKGRHLDDNILLQPGDTIIVP